jgi:hypothetical protein
MWCLYGACVELCGGLFGASIVWTMRMHFCSPMLAFMIYACFIYRHYAYRTNDMFLSLRSIHTVRSWHTVRFSHIHRPCGRTLSHRTRSLSNPTRPFRVPEFCCDKWVLSRYKNDQGFTFRSKCFANFAKAASSANSPALLVAYRCPQSLEAEASASPHSATHP